MMSPKGRPDGVFRLSQNGPKLGYTSGAPALFQVQGVVCAG